MLVVADSSPFIALIQISHLDVLPALFGQVAIPPQVVDELRAPGRPFEVRTFANSVPAWLAVRAPTAVSPIPGLQQGEIAAINLAREIGADLLLIDEIKGRKAATVRGLRITGTLGVLTLAAEEGLLDLRESFERLGKTNFWASRQLLDDILRGHEQGKDE